MSRVVTYIDGFNFYHAVHSLKDPKLKWVNLWALSNNILRDDQTLAAVKYFTAYAKWRPGAFNRHLAYVAALEAQGVTPIIGRFKEKTIRCQATCRKEFVTHEEKETDVNIGIHLVTDALQNRFDTALVISADTDLVPAVKLARSEASEKRVFFVAPPKRFNRNRELPPLFEITPGKLRASLLPHIVTGKDGKLIRIPNEYK